MCYKPTTCGHATGIPTPARPSRKAKTADLRPRSRAADVLLVAMEALIIRFTGREEKDLLVDSYLNERSKFGSSGGKEEERRRHDPAAEQPARTESLSMTSIRRFLSLLCFLGVLSVATTSVRGAEVTIITHGYAPSVNLFLPNWRFTMANAILNRAGSSSPQPNIYGSVYVHDVTTGRWRDPTSSEKGLMSQRQNSHRSDEHVVLVYDWISESNDPNSGWLEAGADSLFAALLTPPPALGISTFVSSSQPLHFIGHSRGAVLNSRVCNRIGWWFPEVKIDHVTSLDPHPAWAFGAMRDPGYDQATGTGLLFTFKNVNFADNYYQLSGAYETDLGFNGVLSQGASFQLRLTGASGANIFSHSDVHAWYHGTIDLSATTDGDISIPTDNSIWYSGDFGPRSGIGYRFSRVGAGRADTQNGVSSRLDPVSVQVLVNGSFSDRNDTGTQIPGWERHGGGGNAPVPSQFQRLLVFGDVIASTGVTRTHNPFYLPPSVTHLAYEYQVIEGSADEQLVVLLNDGAGDLQVDAISVTATTGQISRTVPIPTIVRDPRGKVCTLTFKLRDTQGIFVDADVLLGNVRFTDSTDPTVETHNPASGSTLRTTSLNLDINFTETIKRYGTGKPDRTDLQLSGSAAANATVGEPTPEGRNTWRYPISGLVAGSLSVSLASSPGSIQDLFDNNLAPQNWSFTVDLSGGGTPGSQTVNRTSSADAEIRANSPTGNFGSGPFVNLYSPAGFSGEMQALVKFTPNIPTGSTVDSVELRLTEFGSGTADLAISPATATWTESDVTWNNRPGKGSPIILGAATLGWTFRSSDWAALKTTVQTWVDNSAQNHGLYLSHVSSLTTSPLIFYSREDGTAARRPTLVINYREPQDNQGDTITGLNARKSSSGSTISERTWQRDNDPYFSWSQPSSVSPIMGYSWALDAQPSNGQNLSAPAYSFPNNSLADGVYFFRVKSVDANGNWGPVVSFEIWVDTSPPALAITSPTSSGAYTTSASIVTISGTALDSFSGVASVTWNTGAGNTGTATLSGNNWTASNNPLLSGANTITITARDIAGNTQPASITIIRESPPTITTPPQNQSVLAGGSVSFSVVATGDEPLSYQWLYGGTNIPGATAQSFVLSNVQPDSAGLYQVVVSNSAGVVLSSIALLSVVGGTQDFVPTSLASTAWNYLFDGDSLNRVIEFSGALAVETYGVVFRGGNYNYQKLSGTVGLLTFHHTMDPTFYWEVGNHSYFTLRGSAVGTGRFMDYTFYANSSRSVNFGRYQAPPPILRGPDSQAVIAGSTASFGVEVNGLAPLFYQWHRGGVALSGETGATLMIANPQTNQAGNYSVSVSNAIGSVTSPAARLTVIPRLDWRVSEPGVSSATLKGIAFGGGQYVAVGEGGLIRTSPDGTNWTRRVSGVSGSLEAITYANGQFVAVGFDEVAGAYSPMTLTLGRIVTSDDGITWTSRLSGMTNLLAGAAGYENGGGRLTGLAYGGGKFVAVGHRYSGPAALPAVFTSSDGEAWGEQLLGSGGGLPPVGPPTVVAELYCVTHDGRQFLAAGRTTGAIAESRIICSADGVTWAARTAAVGGWFNSLLYANGQYVAVGGGYGMPSGSNGTIATSTDGTNWTARLTLTNGVAGGANVMLNGVAYGGGRYVAVGAGGVMVSSTNGQTWTPIAPVVSEDLGGVAFANGQFVAVGGNSTVIASATGQDWSFLTTASARPLRQLIHANGQYVAVGEGGVIRTSPDGTNWTRRVSGVSGGLEGIAYANGQYVAVGYDLIPGAFSYMTETRGRIVTSGDGVIWTSRLSGVTNQLMGVAYGNGMFVAVGNGPGLPGVPPRVLTSTNGLNWVERNLDTGGLPYTDGLLTCVMFDGLQFRVGGTAGPALGGAPLYSSTDALTWTRRDTGVGGSFSSLLFTNGQYVAVGGEYGMPASGINGKIATSTDRVNWTVRLTLTNGVAGGTNLMFTGVTYGNGRYVAVGRGGGMASSTNGQTWTQAAPVVSEDLGGVTFANGQFVAVGGTSTVVASINGQDWSFLASAPTRSLRQLVHANGQYVAVGTGGVIQTSPDGTNWTRRVSGVSGSLQAITYANGKFVAVGYDVVPGAYSYMTNTQGRIVTSSDGITWTSRLSGATNQLMGVAYGNGKFVAVGYGQVGTITGSSVLTSMDGVNWAEQSLVPAGAPPPVGISPSGPLYCVAFDGTQFLAAGTTGGAISGVLLFSSADGVNWISRTAGVGGWFSSLLFTNGQYVAVGGEYGMPSGATAKIATSLDGTNWMVRLTLTNSVARGTNVALNCVAYGDGRYMAVGGGGLMLTSLDGQAWAQMAPAVSDDLGGVTFANGQFAAVGGNTDSLVLFSEAMAANQSETAPRILTQPASAILPNPPSGQATAMLEVVVTGTGPMLCQWQKDGVDLTPILWLNGQQFEELGRPVVVGSDATVSLPVRYPYGLGTGDYRLVVSNAVGVVTSAVATVRFAAPPTFYSFQVSPPNQFYSWPSFWPPTGVNILTTNGGTVTLSASAGGENPQLQWFKDGAPIPTMTVSTLVMSNVIKSTEGSYWIRVTNLVGTNESPRVSVRVVPPKAFNGAPVRLGDGRFRILFGNLDGGGLTMPDTTNITVQASTNLQNWVTLTNGLTIIGGQVQVNDADSPNLPRRFYRILER